MRVHIAPLVDDERPRPVGEEVVHEQHRAEDRPRRAAAPKGVDARRVAGIGEGIARLVGDPARGVPDHPLDPEMRGDLADFADKIGAVGAGLQGVGVEDVVRPFERIGEGRGVVEVHRPHLDPLHAFDRRALQRIGAARDCAHIIPCRERLAHLRKPLPPARADNRDECHDVSLPLGLMETRLGSALPLRTAPK